MTNSTLLSRYQNLTDIFKYDEGLGSKVIRFIYAQDRENCITYKELYDLSCKMLFFLQEEYELKPGSKLIFQLEDNYDFIVTFWACLLGGIIPVPITTGRTDEHRLKLIKIWEFLERPKIIGSEDSLENLTKYLESMEDSSETILPLKQQFIFISWLNRDVNKNGVIFNPQPSDLAFIQFSSGSTGDPKGVMLTHKNLLVNINSIIHAAKVTSGDRYFNWMPLTHDMGIIGCHLVPTFVTCDQNIMDTNLFIRHPLVWINKVHEHKATVLASPNFGYRHFLKQYKPDKHEEWDLSHVRVIYNGAEPISTDLTNEFLDEMSKYGLKRSSMLPAYGMAEASLAVSLDCVDTEFKFIYLDRNSLSLGDVVKEVGKNDVNSIALVELGQPVIDVALRICDANNQELPENTVGFVQIKGENVTQGYYKNPVATSQVLSEDGWLNTGDLGFLRNGRLFFTGRAKDIIFVNGQNYYPNDLEEVVLGLPGIELNRIAFCGFTDHKDQREIIMACVLYRKNLDSFIPLATELKQFILSKVGIEVTYVIPVKQIPRTTSGKLQRYKFVQSYLDGEYTQLIDEVESRIIEALSLREIAEPTTKNERILADLSSKVLGIDQIGVGDNLIHFGLNSIKAASLIFAIEEEFGVLIPLKKLFTAPTVKELAVFVDSLEQSTNTPIKQLGKEDYYPISAAQKRVFAANQIGEDHIGYNLPFMITIEGSLDLERFTEVLNTLIQRYESIRTSFEIIDEKPIQKIWEKVDFTLPYYQIPETELEKIIENFVQPFDLSVAPLFKACLIQVGSKHLFLCDVHHIIADASSIELLINEMFLLYSGEVLPELKIQYKDFANWQAEFFRGEDYQKMEKYWLGVFSDEIPILNLPTDYLRPALRSYRGDRYRFSLDAELFAGLNRLAREHNVTIYMLLYTLMSTMLARCTGQEDLILGVSVPGRSHPDVMGLFGMFVNILAVRNKPEGRKTFKEFLQEIKEILLTAYEHQDYQFNTLVEKLNIPGTLDRSPLVDAVLVMQNVDRSQQMIGDIKFTQDEYVKKASVFDITFNAFQNGLTISFDWEYSTDLFAEETIARMANHLIATIGEVIRNPEITLAKIEMLSPDEKNRLLNVFNNTRTEFSSDKTIQQIFEEQVIKSPERVAVSDGVESLTYAQLNERANKVAKTLREKGVIPDTIIGLVFERNVEMIVAILGVLKSGGAYLPIASDYPSGRIRFMLENSNSKILLSTQQLIENLQFVRVEVIALEDIYSNVQFAGDHNPELVNNIHDLAYIIYTSGSTGNPKGVMIEQRSVISLIAGLEQTVYYQYTEPLNIALVAPYIFDASVQQIFSSLLLGHSLYIVPEETRKNGADLFDFYTKYQIEVSDLTPTHISQMNMVFDVDLKDIPVRHFIVGGEVLYQKEVKSFLGLLKTQPKIHNVYGPTECCVDSTSYLINPLELTDSGTVPIGSPLANERIYILGKNLEILPVGAVGEIFISGLGIARGYLQNPELTTERFIVNPYEPGGKMYKTGDLARRLRDGNIEFIGRADYQVKLRGFRIELGEVEAKIVGHHAVTKAVVVDKIGADGFKYLCAYVVLDRSIEVTELRDYLIAELPEYMIPSVFFQITELPLTPSGKIDRRALPEPELESKVITAKAAPKDYIEARMIELWKDVLSVEEVGVDDDFFEHGGHSLNATVLVSKINKEFNVKFPLREIFKRRILKEVATVVRELEQKDFYAIKQISEQEYYQVSSAQKRLYVISESQNDSVYYNAPVLKIIDGGLDIDRFIATFKELVRRHDSLRTSFDVIDDVVVERVHQDVQFEVRFSKIEKEEIRETIERFIQPFDLHQPPLFRVEIANFEDSYLFMLDIHHIISDAISMEIIFNEIDQLYSGNPLHELKIQYKDFAFWQNQALQSERIKEQEKYWVERFRAEIPVLKMPTDFTRPAVSSYEGDQVEFSLNNDLSAELKNISKANEATLFMTLLTGFNILLAKYTGQDDIIVGTPIAGRQHADLLGIVGCFVNMLPMRNILAFDLTFTQLLNDVKENALKAYENQDYQFELLVDKLGLERQSGRNPLFDIVFALQNTGDVYLYSDTDVVTPESKLVFKPVKVKHTISKFDITVVVYEDRGNLNFKLEYCTQLFKRETMERFADHFINLLGQIVADPDLTLSQLDILSESEKAQILQSFNDTQVLYDKEQTIVDLFEEQVMKNPKKPAVYAGNKLLTYEELNQKSNRVGGLLRDRGVGPNQIVGLMTDRSIDMIVGILGILKAGGAYLPIGLEYPKARIEYLLKDSCSKLLLHSDSQDVEQLDLTIERLSLCTERLNIGEINNLDRVNKPTDLAYVIYTSGSTGTPKGVMVEHWNVINLLVGLQQEIYSRYGSGLKVALVAPYIFDASVQQIFAALLHNHCLYIVPEDVRRDGESLVEFYREHGISISDGTPTHLSLIAQAPIIVDDLPVKHFIIGGDRLYQDNVRNFLNKFRDYQPLITNIYGPTECCVDSTAYLLKEDDEFETVPIGHPLSNVQVYILGAGLEVLPVGVVGEIYISGDSVTRGYLGNSELTLERFISDPFRPDQRMYKTGDLGRWNSDGNIEFVGRVDYQVKVRGYRIEPGEIESRLLRYPGIEQVAVIDRTDNQGVKYLVAYLVHSVDMTEEELREHLALELPDYMIPAYFSFLDEMPLKSNGKIDRQALLEPALGVNTSSDEEKPKNRIEEKMMAIWKDVLDLTRVSRDCDFFEVGGHSLNATLLVSRVNKEFGVKFPLREVFKRRTLKEMAKYIKDAEIKAYSSIAKIEEREFYPVSAAQKRVYTLTRFDEGGIGYNAPIVMELKGSLNTASFEKAFIGLIRLHESLRTSFHLQGEEIVQKIHQDVDFTLEHFKVAETGLKAVIQKFIRPFELSQAPLLRAGIIKTPNRTLFMLDMHHIISDGVSMDIMLRDLFDLYQGKELIPGPVQYKDFAVWQNQFLKSPVIKEQEEYWLNTFTGDIPVLNLPTDFPWPSVMTFAGDNLKFTLDQKLFEALQQLTRKADVTLFMTLVGSLNVLLAKYTGQDDIIIGTPVAGRRHADLEHIVGSFINTLALRNQPAPSKTFKVFLQEVKDNAISAFENQDYQFDMLIDNLGLERNMSRNPLFDVMCVLQNANDFSIYTRDLTNFGTDSLRISNYDYEYPISKFSLVLVAYEIENELHFRLDYSTALFKRETIVKMVDYFINLLKAVVQYPETKLADIRLVSNEEKSNLLYDFNQTKVPYPLTTIHQLFEEQVLKTPKQIAAIFEDTTITYQELNEKANQVARKLKAKGVKPEQIVGIMVHASIEALIGIFAILKAGGAYLPIDPEYPEERIDYILKDSDIQLLLTQKSLHSKLLSDCEVLNLDDSKLYTGDNTNLSIVNNPTNLIYVIYTSGSTGRPKGTLIEHQGVVNYITWAKTVYLQGEECDFPLYSSLAFDLTVTSIYVPLLSASKVIIYAKDEREMLISKIIRENRVDIVKLTPAHLKVIAGLDLTASRVKRLIVGGEALKTDLATEIYQKFGGKIEIYNEYGPTETVVGCMIYRYEPEKDHGLTVPIGIPADNVQIYLLDSALELVGVGMPGEVYIAGDGVGRGYLKHPELTAEKFVANPYVSGGRMYQTGDLGRRLPDGNIEFLGRIDHQVKVRGYRIELAEIEKILLTYTGVKEAVVIDRIDSDGETYLSAFLVIDTDNLSLEQIKDYLSKKLPEYMIPSNIMEIEKIPLTVNGKIDRKALLNIDKTIDTEKELPGTELEAKLLAIWEEVLGKELGIYDNFFESGGQSIKATQLIARVNQRMNVEMSLMEVFMSPTVVEMAAAIDELQESLYESIIPIPEAEYYHVSAAQQRIYTLAMMDKDGISYNAPVVLEIDEDLDIFRLESAFSALVTRHEALRTIFTMMEDKVVQKVLSEVDFAIEIIEAEELEVKEIIKDFIRAFDLEKAPLLRVGVIRTPERMLLMLDIHHIIADAVSMKVIFTELNAFYEGKCLEPLEIQYKDFATWQNELFLSDKIKNQEEYWLKKFSEEIPVLNLPIDFKRPVVLSFEGDSIYFALDKDLTNKLHQFTVEREMTLFMTLFTAFNVLLAKYSAQEDIIIGTPVAGRRHADLENIIGMFVNTLALRNYPKMKKTGEEFLSEVKESSLEAFDNQDYQFDMLIEKLELKRDTAHTPLFDVMFAFQNATDVQSYLEESGLKFIPYDFDYKIAKFNLVLVAYEMDNQIHFKFDYSTALFKQTTVELMGQYYVNILSNLITHPNTILQDIQLITEQEKTKLLYEFNATESEYPKEKTIQQLFAEQVYKTPDHLAVIMDKVVTYKELDILSDQLARVLVVSGVKEESIVGIMADHSVELIVGILGVLKANGAFLPIDPDYPEKRIKYMLADSGCKILLTQTHLMDEITDYVGEDCAEKDSVRKHYAGENFAREVICLDNLENYISKEGELTRRCSPENLAYVIYTSGSTGLPKGTLVHQRGVVNYITWAKKIYLKGDQISVPLYSSIAFDLTITSVFVPLLSGNKIAIYDTKDKGGVISKIIEEDQVDVMKLTPAHLKIIQELDVKSSRLKTLIVGGENLSTELANRIYHKFKGDIRIYNEYGPTETVVGCMIHQYNPELDNGISVPIGKPADNVQIYLLDSRLEPVGIGIPGELYISGDGVSRGYLNQPELTEEKFIENPFIQGQQMYKTGDLGRMLSDGNIEFLGRLDQQIKVRGYRIELAEIEEQLRSYEGIKEAVVLEEKDTAGETYLAGYVVSDREDLAIEEVREYLLERLPEYMIPGKLMEIEKIPLTINGKVDRQALMELKKSVDDAKELPRTEVEAKLLAIWEEVLGKNMGIHDNFFEHGGQSIKATQLIVRVNQRMNVELSLMEVFMRPTVAEMAIVIDELQDSLYEFIKPIPEAEYYEVSAAQRRIYALTMFDRNGTIYNVPVVMELGNNISLARLENAFKKLITRHEAFRTLFTIKDSKLVQQVLPEVDFTIKTIDVEEIAVEEIIKNFIRPFDFEKAPLLRAGVIRTPERMLLMLDIHHIITDAVSIKIIYIELNAYYAGEDLEPLNVQYKDFAAWQNELLLSGQIKNQEEYWLNKFAGEIPVLNLPTDFLRPSFPDLTGDSVKFVLNRQLTADLKEFGAKKEITLFMSLLAIFNILLAKYSNEEDIIVGTPIAGRRHVDLENVIGIFINTLALRNYPESNKTFEEFLAEVKQISLEAFDNQDYQFDMLVDKLELKRDLGHNPLFDVMFALQNATDEFDDTEESELNLKPYNFEYKTAIYNLVLVAFEMNDELHFRFEYSTALFKHDTIMTMAQCYLNIVTEVLKNPQVYLQDILLISENYRDQLIYQFNQTEVQYYKDRTIQQLFKEQVINNPSASALCDGEKTLTYEELDRRTNQLACLLREKGVSSDQIVGLFTDRSVEMVVGILGVLKAGGAYLPLDLHYPVGRIQYMLKDSGCKLLIHTDRELSIKDSIDMEIEFIRLESEVLPDTEIDIANLSKPTDLAYVIYTSGSTGNPKGVMIEHRNVINLMVGLKEKFYTHYGTGLNVALLAPYIFDASVQQIFAALLLGHCLYIVPEEIRKDGTELVEFYREYNIQISDGTPTHLSLIAEALNNDNSSLEKGLPVEHFIIGGDILYQDSVRNFLASFEGVKPMVTNVYGPTECSVDATAYDFNPLDESFTVSIGRPLSNVRIYVLDKTLKPVPMGVVGDIYISGDGLARGYLANRELTAERFIPNPFIPEERMYDTGDLGRWLSNSNIEFMGRSDYQVKIRGFRIELGEIEAKLLKHPGVKRAVVVDKVDRQGNKYLVLYYVRAEAVTEEDLRDYLTLELPEYMIPAFFVELTGLPVKSNGKIDRQALKDRILEVESTQIEESPKNSTEEKLIEIWHDIFDEVVLIHRNSDFFELGGHSLNAAMMVSRVTKEFGVKLPLREVFKRRTIKDIAEYISETISLDPELKSIVNNRNVTKIDELEEEFDF